MSAFSNHDTWLFMSSLDDIRPTNELYTNYLDSISHLSKSDMIQLLTKWLMDNANLIIDNGNDTIEYSNVIFQELAQFIIDEFLLNKED